MDYMHTHPNAHLRFFAGNMQLCVDSDAAYLVMLGSRSCIAGHFYLVSHPHLLNYNHSPKQTPFHNACLILKHTVCSAAEVECTRLFHNC
eukprot:7381798-Ditylum_brightwellii.AAC.1